MQNHQKETKQKLFLRSFMKGGKVFSLVWLPPPFQGIDLFMGCESKGDMI